MKYQQHFQYLTPIETLYIPDSFNIQGLLETTWTLLYPHNTLEPSYNPQIYIYKIDKLIDDR